MQIYYYNQQIAALREERGLTLKECAKGIGISAFRLSLYEMGYFRPKGKALAKIENFFNTKILSDGDRDYPGPIHIKVNKRKGMRRKTKLIISGSILLASVAFMLTGSLMFKNSTNSANSFYGKTYLELREKAVQGGRVGRDIVTNLEYYYLQEPDGASNTSLTFYKTNSILYFNEISYSISLGSTEHQEFGTGRFHMRFGDNLGETSYRCFFDIGSNRTGDFFSFSAIYKGGYEFGEINNLQRIIKSTLDVNEEYAKEWLTIVVPEGIDHMNKLLENSLGRKIDLYEDYLKDREHGRKVNFSTQIVSLSMIIPNIIAFFVALFILLLTFIKNMKSHLTPLEVDPAKKQSSLPKDIHLPFGIPDNIILILIRVIEFTSLGLLILSLLKIFGILPLPSFFANSVFLEIMKTSFITAPFLGQFVMISSIRKDRTLFYQIIRNVLIYIAIASVESFIVGLMTGWGYDVAELIFNYIPGPVFQVVVFNYLIYLFLFFQPNFIKVRDKKFSIIWRCLSIIPLAGLIASIVISNSYLLVYGVEKNIYLKFWFPDTLITISIVCVVYIYLIFLIRYLLKRKFGKEAVIYFFSDRYMLISNLIYVILIVAIFLIDLLLANNEFAYYLGFRNEPWILILIPFIIFCKCSPSTIELFESEFERIEE